MSTPDLTGQIIQAVLLVAGGGTVGAIVTAFFNRRKTGAEALGLTANAESTLSEATIKFANYLQGYIDKLRIRLEQSEEHAESLEKDLREVRVKFSEAEQKSAQLQEILKLH